MLTRRRFLLTGGAAAAGTAATGMEGFLECSRLELKRVEIRLERLPEAFDGFSIAQLSDFHYEDDFSGPPLRKAVDLVNRLRPDLIVLTGDYVTVPLIEYESHNYRQAAKSAIPCAEILASLEAPMGRFAVLGNHDATSNPLVVVKALEGHGIHVLGNRSEPIERGGSRFWLAGIDDALDGLPDLGAAIHEIPPGEAVVLLVHEPDFADQLGAKRIDLQLSGHSHGGQIWIPGIGAPWLPSLARKYPRGLYRLGHVVLYTNIGIGTIRAPIRINCTPEVTLITLRSARAS